MIEDLIPTLYFYFVKNKCEGGAVVEMLTAMAWLHSVVPVCHDLDQLSPSRYVTMQITIQGHANQ